MLLRLITMLCLLLASGISGAATIISPIDVYPAIVEQYARVEVTFQLSQVYSNPFDPDEVDARALITQPDGEVVTIPAFAYREYDLVGDSPELIINGRNPSWKVRFAPRQVGTHNVTLRVTDLNGTTSPISADSFESIADNRRGMIRVDPADGRFLVHDDGTAYHSIGRNLGWATNAGTKDYARWFDAKAATGQNFARIWMTHFFRGQSIEWSASHHSGYYEGLGRYSLPLASRLDRIVELAEEHDIAIMIALHHHGQFSTTVNPNWNDNPYNIARAADGGFLNTPQEFFTHPEARALTKRRLRYIIARWGYSSSILCWELFNEVQFTSGFRESATQRAHVAAWHDEMGEWIKANDPFGHLVSTSSDHIGFGPIWSLPSMELTQHHDYSPDKIRRTEEIHASLSAFGKPVLFTEFGAPGNTPEFNVGSLGAPFDEQMVEGLVLHNGIWSSALLGSSAMYWWWEYVEEYGHDALFTPLANYLEGETFAGKDLVVRKPAIMLASIPQEVVAVPGITGFFEASGETEFVLNPDGVFPQISELSQWLHGTYQQALRSDPAFTATFGVGAMLTINVESVSNAGSNRIEVRVDGASVLNQALTNGATNFNIAVPVPAGNHNIQIVNMGQDWVRVNSYVFSEAVISVARSIGMTGPRRAYAWVYDRGSDYGLTPHGVIDDLSLMFTDMDDGLYTVEFHDTWGSDGVVHSATAFSTDGELIVPVPAFERDIAVKVFPTLPVDGFGIDSFGIY